MEIDGRAFLIHSPYRPRSTGLLAGLSLVAMLLAGGCSNPEGTRVSDCDDRGELHPVCGMQSPEDIAVVPGGRYLLLSELGNMGEFPGRILLFDVGDESWRPLYPPQTAGAPAVLQGDPGCSEPPGEALSPHGSHLVQLDDGSWRYLVVNHGGREAVELFSLAEGEDGVPQLAWQGCVLAPDNAMLNDVVGLSNGDVLFSRMYRPDDFLGSLMPVLGAQSGDVWGWNRDTGLKLLPDTAGSLTNGLEISPDGAYLFINQYMDDKVIKYDLSAEEVVGVGRVASGDNSAWGPDGKLWVASQRGSPQVYFTCMREPKATCGMTFESVAVDPQTMQSQVVFSHQGPPMGAATVAVPLGDKVYLGSYLGDRLLVVPRHLFDSP
jgi:hypothetical protein